jgi:hypothetical protein
MSSQVALALAIALGITTVACSKATGVQSTSPQVVRQPPREALLGPHVPAGATFSVQLDQELATGHSAEGEPFTARVNDDVRTPDGQIFIPAGAVLHGRVARAKSGYAPLLELTFDRVQTAWGSYVPLHVRVERTGQRPPASPGPLLGDDPAVVGPGAYTRSPHAGRQAAVRPSGVSGAFPTARPFEPAAPDAKADVRELRLRAGGTLELRLTRPLLP